MTSVLIVRMIDRPVREVWWLRRLLTKIIVRKLSPEDFVLEASECEYEELTVKHRRHVWWSELFKKLNCCIAASAKQVQRRKKFDSCCSKIYCWSFQECGGAAASSHQPPRRFATNAGDNLLLMSGFLEGAADFSLEIQTNFWQRAYWGFLLVKIAY